MCIVLNLMGCHFQIRPWCLRPTIGMRFGIFCPRAGNFLKIVRGAFLCWFGGRHHPSFQPRVRLVNHILVDSRCGRGTTKCTKDGKPGGLDRFPTRPRASIFF